MRDPNLMAGVLASIGAWPSANPVVTAQRHILDEVCLSVKVFGEDLLNRYYKWFEDFLGT